MEPQTVNSIICPNCTAELAAGDERCPHCGAATRGSGAAAGQRPRLMDSKWLNNPWMVLGLCFFALAIFGLPLIWKTRAFSTPVKWLVSIVMVIYTIAILWLFFLVMAWCWTRISDALML